MRSLFVPNLKEGILRLSEEETRHAVTVLRAKIGFSYALMDGKGGTAEGIIIELDKRSCVMEVGEISRESLPQLGLTMIVTPTKKKERFEWFLEKATEIGVDRIYPVFTSRSESKIEKFDRWNKVLISAMKQSKRTWLPKLMPAMALIDAVSEISDSPHLAKNFFVAHCMDAVSLSKKTHLLKALVPGESTCIAIGPEGDFTTEEVEKMLDLGAKEITLGDMRLRSETAAIVAVTFFAARQV
ncbi:MAG: 16S rRNA (uracil(1498)-N(3))-methyltransferase [Flavobacteriales bacterium]|jgi:16S rRNA (uracil1498-N3)-methyltransferase|nr:16S rRNA (uracil(1498)-N(3))-methyltransferase [Flavobacteriales bacterium]MBT6174585.1 16S rRNA (uracil(1498)-N(3))-methyltransferase [Flavobacteriales bacterium]